MYRALLLSALTLLPLGAQVKITRMSNAIPVEIDGKPFTTFYLPPNGPKPFLAPLRTASGAVITRGYPMELLPGESRDHPHHRGLWFTHGDVNGVDFWMNEQAGENPRYGFVLTRKVLEVKGGEKSGTIHALFEWQTPDQKPLLSEDRSMVFYSDPKLRIIDFDVTFTALQDKVKFGDTKEGFFAIRLLDSLSERKGGTGTMTNAEGRQKMKEVWGKPSPWVDYAGTLDGQKIGIAIFDHPGNPKHPTTWHSRDYGLFAANPFGDHDFQNDKTKDGSVTIEKGKSLRFRYRVLIHPGDTAEAGLPALYKEYAK
jgi:hypothetical protein